MEIRKRSIKFHLLCLLASAMVAILLILLSQPQQAHSLYLFPASKTMEAKGIKPESPPLGPVVSYLISLKGRRSHENN